MRVIAGTARGRKLRAFRGNNIRPTPDRVREGVFNVMGDFLPGSRGLDLFAGTGGIGIEALSRDAAGVVFVDQQKQSADLIQKNLSLCAFRSESPIRFQVICKHYSTALDMFRSDGSQFDWIYIDPPYKQNLYETTLQKIEESGVLKPERLILVEHFHKSPLPQQVGSLSFHRILTYGSTRISIFR